MVKTKLLKNKDTKEIFWAFVSKGIAFIFFYSFTIFLARILGVEEYGKWSFFYSWLSIIFVVSYSGIDISSRVFIAKEENTKNISEIMSSAFSLRFFISIIFSAFIIFILLVSSEIISWDFKNLLLIAVPFIFFKGFTEFFRNIFQGIRKVKYQAYLNFIEYGLNFVLVVCFFKFLISLESIVLALIISCSITFLVGFILAKKITNFQIKLNFKNRYFQEIFKYALPLIFINFGFLLMTELDTIMLGYLSNHKQVGFYSVAKNIVNKLPQIAMAITMGTMPAFAKMSKDNLIKSKEKFKKLIKANFILYFLLCLGIILLAPFFIPILFGLEYHTTIKSLQILSIWLFFVSFNIYFDTLLDYQKKAFKRAWNFFFAICANIILNILLIPQFAAVGAALGTTISYFIYIILNFLEVRNIFRSVK